MTLLKVALAGAAMTVLLIIFATRPAPAPEPPSEPVVRAIPTEPILQPAFDTPSWVPDEGTKKKALMLAYHMIDVTADEPAHAAAEVVDPNERNALDAQVSDKPAKGRARVKLAHRDEAKPEDTCTKHGMHRVEYRKSWRCRK